MLLFISIHLFKIYIFSFYWKISLRSRHKCLQLYYIIKQGCPQLELSKRKCSQIALVIIYVFYCYFIIGETSSIWLCKIFLPAKMPLFSISTWGQYWVAFGWLGPAKIYFKVRAKDKQTVWWDFWRGGLDFIIIKFKTITVHYIVLLMSGSESTALTPSIIKLINEFILINLA